MLGIDTGGPRADLAVVAGGRVMAEASRSVASHGAELPEAATEIEGPDEGVEEESDAG